jgi:transcriptional regulator with XRE-family HTH domain
MFIGQNLRRERESKGWSQEALGMAAGGLSQGTVSLIESNKQEASWEQIINFSRAFDIPPEQLIRSDNSPVINIGTQQGSSHNHNNGHNYVIHSDGEVAALKQRVINYFP